MSIFRHGLLANKTAIVTGGATGIGRGITKELMELGCHVIIASRDQEKLRSAAAELEDLSENGSVEHVKCDVRNSDDVTTLMKHAISVRGKIDYLVNNGGGQFPSSAETISDKGWHAVIDTNLTGTFRMCREAVTTGNMRENGGAIVNIICTHNQGFPGMAHTGAARAGVDLPNTRGRRGRGVRRGVSEVCLFAVCTRTSSYFILKTLQWMWKP